MNELTTYRWSFEEDVRHYRAAGIPAIGVWRQKLSDFGEEAGVDLLAESGLATSNLLWAGGFTGSDGHTHREAIDDAVDALRLAAALTSPALVVYTGGRNGHTLSHARRLLATALKELAPIAADLEVRLAIEPMHAGCAGEWTFLTGLDDALNVVARFDEKHVGLVLDTYHFGHDPSLVDRISQFVERIAIVHLGDGRRPPCGEQDRCLLGEGSVPLSAIMAALARAGYDGDYDVELLGDEIAAGCYDELLARSRRAFEGLLVEAGAVGSA